MKRFATTSRRRRPAPARHRGHGRAATTARRTVRPGLAVALVLTVGLSLGGVAAAFFASDGTGAGTVTTGTLEAPTDVTATSTPGTGDVDVSWTAPTSGIAPDGYRVRRVPASGPAVLVCGTSASTTIPGTHCTDEGVPVGSHTYVVTAVQASWTAVATASDAVVVGQVAQAITFTSSPTSPTYGGPSYTVTADGGASGNPVTFGSDSPSVCTSTGTHGATITFVGAGTCTITAHQAGSTYYSAAPAAQQAFPVAKAAQAISFTSTAPTTAVVGGSGYHPAATGGGSGNPVMLTINPATTANCSISSGVVSYLKAGTCTIDADQAGDANHAAAPQVQQSFAISPAAQAITITSTPPADAKVGDTYTLTATGGGSGNPVTFASTTPGVCTSTGTRGATITFVAAGTCSVTADQAGNADYLAAAQVGQSIGVTRKAQAITNISLPTSPTYQGGYTVTATGGGSGNPVTFASTTPAVCTSSGTNGATISFVGAGSCTVTADQSGNGTWAPAPQASVTFTVAKAAQTVSFSPVLTANAGTTATLTATASSGLSVTFSTTSASTVCTVSGNTVTYVGAGSCQLTATQAGNANYLSASSSATVAVSAPSDTTKPVIVSVRPSAGASGGWNAIACTQPGTTGRICITATDNVAVTSVTITLTKSNGRCWDGVDSTSFDSSYCSGSVTLSPIGGVWASNVLARQNGGQPNFTETSYNLTVTVKDAANNTATTSHSFSFNGA
jgi:hypothetical protein